MNHAPESGDCELNRDQVEGDPQPTELAQWLPEEGRWWTERALRNRGGLDDKRMTGSFLLGLDRGRWKFRIFTDDERHHVFGRPGIGTIPPTPD